MTPEKIQSLWKESQWIDENNPRMLIEEVVQAFAEKILFEGATMVCVNCALYGPSLPTRSPDARYHELKGAGDYVHRENCRAVRFYVSTV